VKPMKNSLIALFDLSCEDIHTKQEESKNHYFYNYSSVYC